jgi:hypothetical protein
MAAAGPRQLLRILGEDVGGRFIEHRTNWPELLEDLRETPAFGLRLIEADAVLVLGEWFTIRGDGWQVDPDRWGLLGNNAFGAAWEYEGVHNLPFAFNGTPATNRDVTVRGFTVIGPPTEAERRRFQTDPDRARFRRYVDWAGLYAQLGLTLNWRIPVPTDQLPGGDAEDPGVEAVQGG